MGRIPLPPPPRYRPTPIPPAHHDPGLSPEQARAITPVDELWDEYKATAPPELSDDHGAGGEG